MTTQKLENSTTHEAWYVKKSSVHHLRVFKSIAYAHIPASMRNKHDDKAKKCIFIEYRKLSKAYKL